MQEPAFTAFHKQPWVWGHTAETVLGISCCLSGRLFGAERQSALGVQSCFERRTRQAAAVERGVIFRPPLFTARGQ